MTAPPPCSCYPRQKATAPEALKPSEDWWRHLEMQRGVTETTEVIQEIVGRFVTPPDLHHTLRCRVALTEMYAESGLTIMHRLHFQCSDMRCLE